jgi:hypothetical protein
VNAYGCVDYLTGSAVNVFHSHPSAFSAFSAVKSSSSRLVLRCHLIVTLAAASTNAAAQSVAADSAQCFGFTFGTWKPALDLATAGHSTAPLDSALLKAPGGREWASDAAPNDTTLLLFPSWWPVGVEITFARKPRTFADTVTGRATALVASGNIPPPRASVRAWRVACR